MAEKSKGGEVVQFLRAAHAAHALVRGYACRSISYLSAVPECSSFCEIFQLFPSFNSLQPYVNIFNVWVTKINVFYKNSPLWTITVLWTVPLKGKQPRWVAHASPGHLDYSINSFVLLCNLHITYLHCIAYSFYLSCITVMVWLINVRAIMYDLGSKSCDQERAKDVQTWWISKDDCNILVSLPHGGEALMSFYILHIHIH